MIVEVFDDRKGTVFHLILGGFTVYLNWLFIIFFAYEFIEYIYLRGKEKSVNFIGDMLEFSFGTTLMLLLSNISFGFIVFFLFVAIIAVLTKKWDYELYNNIG